MNYSAFESNMLLTHDNTILSVETDKSKTAVVSTLDNLSSKDLKTNDSIQSPVVTTSLAKPSVNALSGALIREASAIGNIRSDHDYNLPVKPINTSLTVSSDGQPAVAYPFIIASNVGILATPHAPPNKVFGTASDGKTQGFQPVIVSLSEHAAVLMELAATLESVSSQPNVTVYSILVSFQQLFYQFSIFF